VRSKWLRMAVAFGLFSLLLITAAAVLGRRVQEGSSYPLYSSFRDDAKGAQLAFDALSYLPGITVERNLRPLSWRQGKLAGATLILAGADAASYLSMEGNLNLLELLANQGCRVIVGIHIRRWNEGVEKILKDGALEKKWQVRLARNSTEDKEEDEDQDPLDTPSPSPFHIADAKGWTRRHSYEGRPVYYERSFGKGAIGLLSEPMLIGNYGVASKLDRELMPVLAGPNPKIIFDETHLGVSESGSIAGLIRRYHLEGAIPALLAVGLLFVWRNSVPFPPPRQSRVGEHNLGRDSRAGLQSLLARNIGPAQLLPLCVQLAKVAEPERLQGLLNAGKQLDPAEIYARIQRQLNPGRKAT
jgi:hypothetical protein